MREEWRDIVGYEGLYQVSNLGRVKGVARKVNRNCHMVSVPERFLNQSDNTNGYLRVSLSKDNHVKQAFVHRLVAEAFVDNPKGYKYIDHLDSDRHNNKPDNLVWCTQSENIAAAYSRGRRKYVPMSDEARARVIKSIAKPVVRSDGKIYPSVTSAARDLGVTMAMVSHVLNGRAQTALGYSFRYAKGKERVD